MDGHVTSVVPDPDIFHFTVPLRAEELLTLPISPPERGVGPQTWPCASISAQPIAYAMTSARRHFAVRPPGTTIDVRRPRLGTLKRTNGVQR